ncbi:MAG: cobyric acid synthase [Synergistaceae bacterium]|jgi:adenosylcobyric acid synthase|nr:cobyric acid synthase [Synergistaceae bacterium]
MKGALMIQGTASDAGKSLVVAGLCRLFTRRGLRVLPFKPQNMSNNAAITADGGEIGRAQALQALACRAEPVSDMNPVLLKPESEMGSQVVVQGHARATVGATDYLRYRNELMPAVMESFGKLRSRADLVLVEGAGSISEVNLRDGDISNMGFAARAGVPVALVADIDRGGALASIVGSWVLLPEGERALLRGYIVNKFRGDLAIFEPAIEIIKRESGLPCLGVVRWFEGASRFPAEDSLSISRVAGASANSAGGGLRMIKIYVLELPRISNFDDFDPLRAEDGVDLSYVKPGTAIPGDGDLVIVPGTKSTIGDLEFLRREGWDVDIAAHLRRGGRVLGICGGYQMLGREVSDPDAVENPYPKTVPGLGLLDVVTVMAGEKKLRRFTALTQHGDEVAGYEIHMGATSGPGAGRPMLLLDGVPEGASSHDGHAMGCYIHGLFGSDSYRARFLSIFRGGEIAGTERSFYESQIDAALDELARHIEKCVDVEALAEIAGL